MCAPNGKLWKEVMSLGKCEESIDSMKNVCALITELLQDFKTHLLDHFEPGDTTMGTHLNLSHSIARALDLSEGPWNALEATKSEPDEPNPKEPKPNTLFYCQKCGKGFLSERWVPIHEKKCQGLRNKVPTWHRLGDDELICTNEGCSQTFASMKALKCHFFKEHIHEEDLIHACPQCSAKFAHSTLLKDHIRDHHLKIHVCHVCGQQFGHRNKLERHKIAHSDDRSFPCSECDFKASRRDNLMQHLRFRHNQADSGTFFCEICGTTMPSASRLRYHITMKHKRTKPSPSKRAQCDQCEYSSNSLGHLNVHIKYVHNSESEPRHSCRDCSKSYKRERDLKVHCLSHDQSKKGSTSKGGLRRVSKNEDDFPQ